MYQPYVTVVIYKIHSYFKRLPLTAVAKATPIPVLPEVGSTNLVPGLAFPVCSASSIIVCDMRSFIEPPGFRNSHFATVGKNNDLIL